MDEFYINLFEATTLCSKSFRVSWSLCRRKRILYRDLGVFRLGVL